MWQASKRQWPFGDVTPSGAPRFLFSASTSPLTVAHHEAISCRCRRHPRFGRGPLLVRWCVHSSFPACSSSQVTCHLRSTRLQRCAGPLLRSVRACSDSCDRCRLVGACSRPCQRLSALTYGNHRTPTWSAGWRTTRCGLSFSSPGSSPHQLVPFQVPNPGMLLLWLANLHR
jgi:hypothetical protein